MGVVLFLNGVQSIRIRVRQIQVVAQHRNVQLVFCKQAAQIGRVAGGEGRGGVGHLLQGLAQRQMHAGKALLVHQRQHLLNGQLFRVVQTQTELDHAWFLLWYGVVFTIIHPKCPRGNTLKPLQCSRGKRKPPGTLRIQAVIFGAGDRS